MFSCQKLGRLLIENKSKPNMIDQYIQVAIEFIKEIWFLLDNAFGLEETQAFKFLKPYLLQAQEKPTYLLIAFFLLVLLPYILYKIKRISSERERKLDALIEEMEEEEEEEIDINDPRRLRRPDKDGKSKPLATEKNSKDKTDLPHLPILDGSEKQDEFHLDTQKIMGQDEVEVNLEITKTEYEEENTSETFDEFEDFEFEVEPDNTDKPTISDNYIIDEGFANDDTKTDELINPNIQKSDHSIEAKPDNETDDLINRLKYFQENLEKRLQQEDKNDSSEESIINDPKQDRNFIERGNYIPDFSPTDKKKNIEVLESFIFLKDQKKH